MSPGSGELGKWRQAPSGTLCCFSQPPGTPYETRGMPRTFPQEAICLAAPKAATFMSSPAASRPALGLIFAGLRLSDSCYVFPFPPALGCVDCFTAAECGFLPRKAEGLNVFTSG